MCDTKITMKLVFIGLLQEFKRLQEKLKLPEIYKEYLHIYHILFLHIIGTLTHYTFSLLDNKFSFLI